MLSDGYHDIPPGKLAMVVTHLEMTDRARLRGVPCPDGLAFETLARDVEAYRDVMRRVGEDWLWFGRLQMPLSALGDIVRHPDVTLHTLSKDGVPEAVLELDFRTPGSCELGYFGLTPKLIGSGAGAYLMDQAIRMAWERPIDRFVLHTCTLDSPQAMAFYQRSGFKPYKRQVEIADDPRLTGIHPKTKAPGVPIL